MAKPKRLMEVWIEMARPIAVKNGVSEKHIHEVERHLERWYSYWNDRPGGKKAIKIKKIKKHHLAEWQSFLMNDGSKSIRTANKHLSTIRMVLNTAVDQGIVKSRPKISQLNQTTNTKAVTYIKDEQIDLMFRNRECLEWPSVGIEPATWWMCAVVLFRTYGFRTQDLIAYEKNKTPLTWKNISFSPESPNMSSAETCEFGWLSYIPSKTAKTNPIPLYLPLTKHARKALDIMCEVKTSDTSPVFNYSVYAEKFYQQWEHWLTCSGLIGDGKPNVYLKPSSFRKSCATYMNRYKNGLASAVCRWRTSRESQVASDRYIIIDELLLRDIHYASYPKCFDLFLEL